MTGTEATRTRPAPPAPASAPAAAPALPAPASTLPADFAAAVLERYRAQHADRLRAIASEQLRLAMAAFKARGV